MEKGNWGLENRVWGVEPEYDAGRIAYIYEALKGLNLPENFSVVDVACGHGIVADGLQYLFPKSSVSQFDIFYYPEWNHLRVKPYCMDVRDFMKTDRQYDVVLFLNSYRNWDMQGSFDEWLRGHAKYFITSGGTMAGKEVIGKDSKDHDLELYRL